MSDIACAFAFSACVASLSFVLGRSADLAVQLSCTYYETLVLVLFCSQCLFVFLLCFPLFCVLYIAALVSRRKGLERPVYLTVSASGLYFSVLYGIFTLHIFPSAALAAESSC